MKKIVLSILLLFLFFTFTSKKAFALDLAPATSNPEVITDTMDSSIVVTLTISGIDPSVVQEATNWGIQINCGGGGRSPDRITNDQITRTGDSISFSMRNTPPAFGVDCKFASGNPIGLDVYMNNSLYGKSYYRVIHLQKAPNQCAVQNPPSITQGEPFDVVVSSAGDNDTTQWTITAIGNTHKASDIFRAVGKSPITFHFSNELLPDSYAFSVVGKNPRTTQTFDIAASCASDGRTTVEPDPTIPTPTPGGNLCWYIESGVCTSSCLFGGRTQAGRPGQYATEDECKAALAQNILTPVAQPSPTPIKPFKPTTCDGDTGISTAFGCIHTSPSGFIASLFGVLLSIAGGVALLLIIYSGYRMNFATNPEGLQGARETLTSAIVGLLFIILSFVILEVIGVDVLHLPGFVTGGGGPSSTVTQGCENPSDLVYVLDHVYSCGGEANAKATCQALYETVQNGPAEDPDQDTRNRNILAICSSKGFINFNRSSGAPD